MIAGVGVSSELLLHQRGSCVYFAAEGGANVAAPIELDACATAWPSQRVDAVFNANMIHISPWSVAEGLFAGAGRILGRAGLLFLYGPFKVAGRHTAPSNLAFDADLRQRNSSWGVRDLEALEELARGVGLELVEKNDLPANNKLLVFGRISRAIGRTARSRSSDAWTTR